MLIFVPVVGDYWRKRRVDVNVTEENGIEPQ